VAKDRVYRYRVYDIMIDDYRYSTRMATKEQIARVRGEIIPGTERKIDAGLVKDGWTEKDFNPDARAQTPDERDREQAAAEQQTYEDS